MEEKEQDKKESIDPSLTEYTKRDGGSCELFKIEIKNLPSYANYTSIKKMITNKFNVKPHKIKIAGGMKSKMAFVAFTCESDRETALKGIHGHVWKGKELEADVASPVLDPFLLKQSEAEERVENKYDIDGDEPVNKRVKVDSDGKGSAPKSVEELLREQVAPLAGLPYDEQLLVKKDEYVTLMQDLLREIGKIVNQSAKSNDRRPESRTEDLVKWFVERRKSDHLFCPMGEIVTCPINARECYRNKCEFSFGYKVNDDESKSVVIGFRLGAYKDGSVNVGSSDSCSLVPNVMKKIVREFENFLNDLSIGSKLTPFNQVSHEGNLTQLTVRSNSVGQSMVIIFLNKQNLTDEEVHEELNKIDTYLKTKDLDIVSLYLQVVSKGAQANPRLIYGQEVITEELSVNGLVLKFNISPNAFFQINTKAAEVCYGTICNLLELGQTCTSDVKVGSVGGLKQDPDGQDVIKPEPDVKSSIESNNETVILDICCGTGTIGLCLASKCKHVFGIELSKQAIEDAKKNAKMNNISNVTFYDGKAESILPLVIQSIRRQFPSAKVVAILDPPRAGLNSSVIKSLRSNNQICKLIYVSCEPRLAKNNMIDLVRPASKAFRGDPFIPVKSALVDMFPDTRRAETLFVFDRLPTNNE